MGIYYVCIYTICKYDLTAHAGQKVVVNRQSWNQIGHESLAGGAIVAEVETTSYERMMVRRSGAPFMSLH